MRYAKALLLIGTSFISAEATAQNIPPILTGNPTAADINQRCDYWVAESTRLRTELENETGPATVAKTLLTYDRLNEALFNATLESVLYREVSTSAESRTAGEKCEVRIGSERNKLSLSRAAYDRLKAIQVPADDPETQLLLTRTLGEFDRSGVALDPAGRAKAQALSDEISQLSTSFNANIPKDQRRITATPAELDGLPQDYLDAHKPGPDGKITLTTEYPDYFPVMTYAKSTELRHRFHREANQRGYPINDPILRDLINKRDELAQLVGRPNYATLNFESRMLNTPQKVQSLIDEMAAAARPAGQRDYAKKLAVLQQLRPGAAKIEPWDSNFLNPIVQKQSYGYDRKEARKYFAYNNVRDGILKWTEELFGVDIRPWQTAVWHEDVEAYELYDKGKLIGRFYFDSHPRPGKFEHANAVPVRVGARDQIPVAALVMNLPKGDHTTGLMEHGDVETFLHEYGHLLHALFGGQNQRWSAQSGFATEWDFVEAPSQMLENWVYDYETLKQFAVDASGNPIPRELVEQMNGARYFDLGMADMRQLGLSNISLQFYLGQAPADLGAAARAADAKYSLIPMADYSQMQASFGHLTDYAAAYYTYRWSVVISDDLFTEFHKNGLRDRATAERYRKLVLEPGGRKPAAQLVEDFLGRPVSIDAYKAKMEKDQ